MVKRLGWIGVLVVLVLGMSAIFRGVMADGACDATVSFKLWGRTTNADGSLTVYTSSGTWIDFIAAAGESGTQPTQVRSKWSDATEWNVATISEEGEAGIWRSYQTAGELTLTAQASCDGESWGPATELMVHVLQAKTMGAPVFTVTAGGEPVAAGGTVNRGETLTIRITETQKDSQGEEIGETYTGYITPTDSWQTLASIEFQSGTRQAQIPTAVLKAGTYRLVIQNSKEGYQANSTQMTFTVADGGGYSGLNVVLVPSSDNTLTANQYMTREQIQIYIAKDGAAAVGIEMTGWPYTDEPWESNWSTEGEIYQFGFEDGRTGTYTFTPYFRDANGTRTDGKPFSIEIKYTKQMQKADIHPTIAEAGKDYTFTVENMAELNASWWSCTVQDADSGWSSIARYDSESYSGNSFTIPGSSIVANHRYQVQFSASSSEPGTEGSYTNVRFIAIASGTSGTGTGATIARLDSGDVKVNKAVRFRVTLPEGTKGIVFFDGEDWRTANPEAGQTEYVFTKTFEKAGAYILQVLSSTETVSYSNWRNQPLVTGNSIALAVTAESGIAGENGNLSVADGGTVTRGEPLHVTLGIDEYTESVTFQMIKDGSGRGAGKVTAAEAEDGIIETMIPTAALEPGEYTLDAMFQGTAGHEAKEITAKVTITEPAAGQTGLLADVSRRSGVPGDTIYCSAYLAGAVRYEVTWIGESTDSFNEYPIGTGRGALFSRTLKSGITGLRIQAVDANGEAMGTPVQIPLAVQSLGTIPLKTNLPDRIDIDPDQPETVTFTVDGLDGTDYWQVQIGYYDPQSGRDIIAGRWGSAYGDAPGSFNIVPSEMNIGQRYQVNIHARAYGYDEGHLSQTLWIVCSETCEHTYETRYSWDGEPTITPKDNMLHTLAGIRVEKEYCSKCGKEGQEITRQRVEYGEMHSYQDRMTDSGVLQQICDVCGHINTCTHENIEHRENIYEEEHYTQKDGTHHYISGKGDTWDVCTGCGKTYNYTSGVMIENQEEPHDFDQTTHTCRGCGYICQHAEMKPIPEMKVEYEWVSADVHNRIERRNAYWIQCPDCYYTLQADEYAVSQSEAHTDADNNGVCDVCGFDISGTWSWRIYKNQLIIEGSGDIQDFSSPENAGWYARRDQIAQIILDARITGIGAYAFSGFEQTVRIDFNSGSRPEMDALALSGSRVKARYYTAGESWTGTYGATEINWIYMPYNNQTSNWGNIEYYEHFYNWEADETIENGWIYNNGYYHAVSREVAEELTFMGRAVYLHALPKEQADRNVYEQHWDITSNLYFFPEGGSGTYSLTIPEGGPSISFDAPGWTLNIDASQCTESGLGSLFAGAGTLNVTADRISTVDLGAHTNEAPAEGNITINADVGLINYYNENGEGYIPRFAGNVTVNGHIQQGYEYGYGQAEIPGVGTIGSDQIIVKQFSDVEQTEPIIRNSELNVAKAEEFDAVYTPENSWLYYRHVSFNGGVNARWELQISPRTEDNSRSIHVSDIQKDYNPDFSLDDIVWGEYTGLMLENVEPGKTIELNGENGKGLNYLVVEGCSVVVNCPVHQVGTSEPLNNTAPTVLTINNAVDHASFGTHDKRTTVTLGANGSIREAYRTRPLYDTLWVENNLHGPCTILQESELRVLSHREGQKIATILPTEAELNNAAAGQVGDGEVAIMTVTDSSLTTEEAAALSRLTTTEGGSAEATFDVTINSVYAGTGETVGTITELGSAVPITVKNVTGGEAYVARVHEGTNGPEAEKLTEATDAGVIPFASNLFSKYVLVRTGMKTFQNPGISVEYSLSDNSILISFPWVDGADYHEISIYKPDGTAAYSWSKCFWGPERSQAEKCLFHVNVISDGQNRMMDAGDYYAEIVLRGEDYSDASFRVDFTVLSSMPDFGTFTIPAGTQTIEEEAFAGISATAAAIPAQCTTIGKKAFASSALTDILILDSVTSFGAEPFPAGTRVFTPAGSPAAVWAEANGYTVYPVIQ